MKGRTKSGGMLWIAPWILMAALASACTRTQAQVSPDAPALDVPLPPSRVITTTNAEAPPVVGTPSAVGPSGVEELSRSSSPPPASSGAAGRQVQAKPTEAAKSDAPVIDLPKPPEEPRTSPLQTTPPQREGEVEAAIRADLNRATSNLNRIDYQRLNPDAKAQYDIAKGNLLQAEAELKAKNFPAAKNLVEKALALAAQLPVR